MRYFNTAGPIIPEDHYYINLEDRINVDEICKGLLMVADESIENMGLAG